MFLHTVNANLIALLRCSTSEAVIKHFVQNVLKGSNPALTYPFFFAKPPTSKGLPGSAARPECFLLGGTLAVWPGASAQSNLVVLLLFKYSEVLL